MDYAKKAESKFGKYIFCYFVGNGENQERIHLAVSEDGYNFTPLNDNKPVITLTSSRVRTTATILSVLI